MLSRKTPHKEIQYKILRDSREQKPWIFPNSEVATLKTGDYTLEGFEEDFVIERKGGISEFVTNLSQPRFFAELQRMQDYKYAFLLLEFNMEDIWNFPEGSGIPFKYWHTLRANKFYILKKIAEIEFKYKVKIILVGKRGKEVAESLFKYVAEIK